MFEFIDGAVRFDKKIAVTHKGEQIVIELKAAAIIEQGDLAMFDPMLMQALFWRDPEQRQAWLFVGETKLPDLRISTLADAIKLTTEGAGYTFRADYGLESIECFCDWDKVAVEPLEGGEVRLTMRIKLLDLPSQHVGKLSTLLDTGDVRMTLKAPEKRQQQLAA